MSSHPFLTEFVERTTGAVAARTVLHPTDPILRDHALAGIPLVPAAVLLEMCCAAALPDESPRVMVVREFEVKTGVRFYGDEPIELTTRATIGEATHCRITGPYRDHRTGAVDPQRVYAECVLESLDRIAVDAPPPAPPDSFEPLRAATGGGEYDPLHEGTVAHGPCWGALAGIATTSHTAAWFQIDLNRLPDEVRRRCQREISCSPVIDALLQACDVLLWRTRGSSQLPSRIHRLQLDRDRLLTSDRFQLAVAQSAEDDAGAEFDMCLRTEGSDKPVATANARLLFRRARG